MAIFLHGISALEYWRMFGTARMQASGSRESVLAPGAQSRAPGRWKPSSRDIESLSAQGFGRLSTPVHLLVPNEDSRWRSSRVVCHVCAKKLPAGSFVKAGDGLYVASPELSFVQASAHLDIPRAGALALELCGSFRFPAPLQEAQFGVRPLTTVDKISSYLEQAPSLPGTKTARKALRYAVEGCESPMEALAFLLLTLPRARGGKAISQPVLNLSLTTTPLMRKATGSASFRCDMFWPEAGLAIEYDSTLHHTGTQRIADDAIRRAALTDLGIEVLAMTARQVLVAREFDAFAELLSKRLGMRMRKDRPAHPARENALRASLIGFCLQPPEPNRRVLGA